MDFLYEDVNLYTRTYWFFIIFFSGNAVFHLYSIVKYYWMKEQTKKVKNN